MSDSPVLASLASAVGDRLRAVRREYGFNIDLANLTQADFAGMIGCSGIAYEMFENGLADPPTAVLLAIRKRTGISLDWLLTGEV